MPQTKNEFKMSLIIIIFRKQAVNNVDFLFDLTLIEFASLYSCMIQLVLDPFWGFASVEDQSFLQMVMCCAKLVENRGNMYPVCRAQKKLKIEI